MTDQQISDALLEIDALAGGCIESNWSGRKSCCYYLNGISLDEFVSQMRAELDKLDPPARYEKSDLPPWRESEE